MTGFIFSLVVSLAVVVSALSVGISSGITAINKNNLKRKARSGDRDAKLVFSLYSQRFQITAVLLILNVLSNTLVVVLISSKISDFFTILVGALIILSFSELLPLMYIKKNVVPITAKLYPVLTRLTRFSVPITKPLATLLENRSRKDTQLSYSKEELLSIFEGQELSKNSDIAVDETRMIRKVLEFGDKKIRNVMTPRRIVTIALQDDRVGPLLMDELHKSGHSRFPVKADKKHTNFVGTLYLHDLVGEVHSKKVKDLMQQEVRYIHEEQSLDNALRAFLKLKHHLFIVVNNFEEFVGVLSIEDVLEEIIGKEIVDEFDQHDDLRKVASSLAQEDKKDRESAEAAK